MRLLEKLYKLKVLTKIHSLLLHNILVKLPQVDFIRLWAHSLLRRHPTNKQKTATRARESEFGEGLIAKPKDLDTQDSTQYSDKALRAKCRT